MGLNFGNREQQTSYVLAYHLYNGTIREYSGILQR